MSKVKQIKDIAKESLLKQLDDLNARILSLEHENADLKKKASSSPSSIIVNGLEVGSEDMVADLELRRLEEAARVRPLSLEEARIYDIMVRSKKTIKETKKKDKDDMKDVTPREISLKNLLSAVKQSAADTPEEE